MRDKRNRLYYIDILKVFACILVEVGHSAYYQMMANFGGINYDQIMALNNISDTKFHKWLYVDHLSMVLKEILGKPIANTTI